MPSPFCETLRRVAEKIKRQRYSTGYRVGKVLRKDVSEYAKRPMDVEGLRWMLKAQDGC